VRVTKEKKKGIAHSWKQKDRRIVVSFQCDRDLWLLFDEFMTEKYGNYKKSILIESLIRKYMKQKKGGGLSSSSSTS